MLASISPLGERARRQRYAVTVAAYVAASTLAGGLLGGLLGTVGAPWAGTRGSMLAIGTLAIIGLLLDARVFGLRVPGPRRQVNEDWLATYRGWVYGIGYGAQLGLGVTTIVTASITWVAFACAAATGSLGAGMLVGATFGLARALPVLATARSHEPSALRNTLARLERLRPPAARVATLLQVTFAVTLLAATTVHIA
jgi:MFS family permease